MAKKQADGEGNIRKRNIMMTPADKDHFTITVPVEVSPTFFAWISTFGRRIKIFDQRGCIAYLCKTPNEARCLICGMVLTTV